MEIKPDVYQSGYKLRSALFRSVHTEKNVASERSVHSKVSHSEVGSLDQALPPLCCVALFRQADSTDEP